MVVGMIFDTREALIEAFNEKVDSLRWLKRLDGQPIIINRSEFTVHDGATTFLYLMADLNKLRGIKFDAIMYEESEITVHQLRTLLS